jgi:GMP synthase (glutamine-hydrolysing)
MNVKKFIADSIKEIKATVGPDIAVSALSGGVDSSTCTMLAAKALAGQLKVIFIDDGLMRESEAEEVKKAFGKLRVEVQVVDAQKEFFKALKRKTDPEKKRKAFRDRFYKVFGREVKRSGARFLIQGTIKADIIETQGGIKTQHNILEQIGIDPEKGYGFKVIEPLKDLFKPEVRLVAKGLGLPARIYGRMPFPGPGLATRVLGPVTPDRVAVVRKATSIVEAEAARLKAFQAFAVLLADRGTGVQEGQRKFGDIIVIRSVDSRDALTAQPTQVPWPALQRMAKKITAELPAVTRVCYELTPKPPATIEYI